METHLHPMTSAERGPLGIGACSLAPFSQGEPGPMSPHRWAASPPACFEHRLPRLDGVVPEHPPEGHWFWGPGRHPSIGAHRDPLRMSGRCVGLELNDLLLIKIRQPSLTFGFLRRGIGGEVLAWHESKSGQHDYLCWGRISPPPKSLDLEGCLTHVDLHWKQGQLTSHGSAGRPLAFRCRRGLRLS